MSIQELSSIKSATDYVIQNLGNESKKAADEVKSLFTQKFYNGSSSSAASIATEIQRLEQYIEQKQNEYDKTYAYLRYTNEELNKANQELQKQIYEVTKMAELDEREQKHAIERAIDETNQDYMNGDIEKSEMQSRLYSKIAKYYNMDPAVLAASTRLNSIKGQVTELTNKIAGIIDQVNCIETESKLAQGTLVLMKNLMGKMTLGSSDSSTAANQRPIYTPTKQALCDRLAQGIKGLERDGEYPGYPLDSYSTANPQLVKMKEFLGLNGDGTLNADGIPAASMLNQMKEAGFTAKEAVYAINWIFDKVNMSYKPGEQWSVPYGHGQEAHETYNAVLDQFDKLWGLKGIMGEDDTKAGDVDPTAATTPTTPTTSTEPTKRTDPIGFANGDTTYEFVIDRNNDQVFNGASEFLGAQKGIDELKALDVNGDGYVSKDEMDSRDDLFVLMTDHNTGAHSFKSISEAGIDAINLKSLSSKNWKNINENILKNTFTINTANGGTVQGYQTLDSDFYLQKSYNGVQDAEMAVTIDETALRQANNIFGSIKNIDATPYGEIAQKASKQVANTQRSVNNTSAEMTYNAQNAGNELTNEERPETADEKEAREAEEAKKAEEEKEAKEAEEAKKAEEDKKDKEEEPEV